MNYDPWPHQLDLYNKITAALDSGTRSVLLQLATRGGKSWIIARLIKKYAVEHKMCVYFVAHTKILIRQMSEELTSHGIMHGIIAPWAPQLKYRVQVISKDSLFSRIKKMKASGWTDPPLIIIDEAHMAMSKRYLDLIKEYPDAQIFGATGTSIRLDKRGLGEIFQKLIVGPSHKELQALKILCPIETFWVEFHPGKMRRSRGDFNQKDVNAEVNKSRIIKNLVYHWQSLAAGKKTLTFCANIEHAHNVANEFTSAGFPSIAVSSKNSLREINEAINGYYSGKYINLCSVNLFVMGFTIKDCECVVQARPTDSLMIYLQTLGRGMMYLPGKTLINIDAVNNIERHRYPDDDREWSLDTGSVKKEPATLKRCPGCQRPVPVAARVCPHCGFQWTETAEARTRQIEEVEGRLVSMSTMTRMSKQALILKIAREARSLKQAVQVAKQNGVDHRGAYHIWTKKLKNSC